MKVDVEPVNTEEFIVIVVDLPTQEEDSELSMFPGQKGLEFLKLCKL
jgi:hypothetical protein